MLEMKTVSLAFSALVQHLQRVIQGKKMHVCEVALFGASPVHLQLRCIKDPHSRHHSSWRSKLWLSLPAVLDLSAIFARATDLACGEVQGAPRHHLPPIARRRSGSLSSRQLCGGERGTRAIDQLFRHCTALWVRKSVAKKL